MSSETLKRNLKAHENAHTFHLSAQLARGHSYCCATVADASSLLTGYRVRPPSSVIIATCHTCGRMLHSSRVHWFSASRLLYTLPRKGSWVLPLAFVRGGQPGVCCFMQVPKATRHRQVHGRRCRTGSATTTHLYVITTL